MKHSIFFIPIFILTLIGGCSDKFNKSTDNPVKEQNPKPIYSFKKGPGNPKISAITGKTVGFWLARSGEPAQIEEITAWNSCAGAKGIMINTNYQWPAELRHYVSHAKSLGYNLLMWGGFDKYNVVNTTTYVLTDPIMGPNIDCLYIDEPTWSGVSDTQLLQIVRQCSTYNKKLALSDYFLPNFEHIRSLVAQNYPSMNSSIIYMPEKYFNVSQQEQFSFYSDVKNWAGANNIPSANVIAWVSPSCYFPGGQTPAPGCSINWTYEIICYLSQIGYDGIFIFTGNGIGSSNEFEMERAFSDCGWSIVNFNCGYGLTY